MNITTIVTGIWDIKRDSLTGHWKRDFNHYLNNFDKLLKTDINMIIFIESKYENFVRERRDDKNTLIVIKEIEWFKDNGLIFEKIQRIRKDPRWYTQVGWLSDSTQAKLEMYNPIVMSKMFLLNDARILDKFNSTHLIWLDGGITNTVHEGYFTHDKVLNKLDKYFNNFTFVAFPYDGKEEIHGFEYKKMCKLSGDEVNKVARGGIFGGPVELISNVNELYYNLLNNTLEEGYMGTEESLFTILMYQYPKIFNYYEIESDGLLSTFFENLKNDNLILKYEKSHLDINKNIDKNNVGLYVIGFNSPKQFETLVASMLEYDKNFILKPKKFLLDNSTDLSTTEKYKELCKKHGFEHIKKNNLGICGGRQFIAEHAHDNNFDYYFFFEDDMFFYPKKGEVCRNGFNRYVENLYNTILTIMKENEFDFLKMNYSEFYGDNGTQWAWYNVPQEVRNKYFPWKKDLPIMGLDPDAPRTQFNSIKTKNGVSYADGEIYYSNWPQIVSNNGNILMFLVDKWERPYEQTWMSYIYQETKKGNIKPGLLLLTPTEHDRFDFYPASERKES